MLHALHTNIYSKYAVLFEKIFKFHRSFDIFKKFITDLQSLDLFQA